MERLDRQIAILEQSMQSSVGSADISMLQQDIDDQYYMLTRMLASGETGELSLQIENMLVDLDRLSVMTEEDSVVTRTLESLKEQKAKMLTVGGNAVTEPAPSGGYFYTAVDGYEALFTKEALSSLTAARFYELLSSPPASTSVSGQTAYGKLAADSTWGFVMEIPFREAAFFEKDAVYSVQFTENNGVSLPMTLTDMIGVPEQSTVLLVMSCDRLPADFSFDRCQSVRIATKSVSGIYVPKIFCEEAWFDSATWRSFTREVITIWLP